MAVNGSSPPPGGEDDGSVVAKLRKQLAEANSKVKASEEGRAAERQGRVRAEQRTAETEHMRLLDSEVAIDNAIHAAETLLGALEQDLAQAMATQDAGRIAKTTRNITTAQNRLDYARGQKGQIEQIKAQGGVRQQPQVEPGEDPRLAPYPPVTRAWIKQHPQFLSDERFRQRALGYHNLALSEGHELESPGYFRYIERGMGLSRKPRAVEDEDDEAPRRTPRKLARGGGDLDFEEGDDTSDLADEPVTTGSAGRVSSRAADSGDRDVDDADQWSVPTQELHELAQISNQALYAKDPQAAIKEYVTSRRVLLKEGRIGPRSRVH